MSKSENQPRETIIERIPGLEIAAHVGATLNILSDPGTKLRAIYHYMPSSSIISILDTNAIKLWASDIRCLNDTSECEDGLRIFRIACQTLKENEKVSSEFIAKIIDLQPNAGIGFYKDSSTGHYVVIKDELKYAYICCFSKHEDSLAMWNYYSKGNRYEGFNIGLMPVEVIEGFGEYFGTGIKPYLFDVVYDDIEKNRIVQEAIIGLYTLYLAHEKKTEKQILEGIQEMLWYWTLMFKNIDFEHEGEVRLILVAPRANASRNSKNSQKLNYRNVNGLLVPYYIIPFSKSTLCSITVGPIQGSDKDKQTQEKILRDFLYDREYQAEQIKISTSNIPVRY